MMLSYIILCVYIHCSIAFGLGSTSTSPIDLTQSNDDSDIEVSESSGELEASDDELHR